MLRFVVALALPMWVTACSCMMSGPPCEAVGKAAAVFVGTVSAVHYDHREPDARGLERMNGFLGTHAIFQVTEGFIGMEGRGKEVEVLTGMGGGDCGYPFVQGQSYVVYASKTPEGQLVTYICSRTQTVERAEADLTFLRSLQRGRVPTFVYGVVQDREKGIAGAAVTLTDKGTGTSSTLLSQADGSFRFPDVPPGVYAIAVSKENYIFQNDPRELTVQPQGCAFAAEHMVVDRRVMGTLIGADGLPAANVQVEVIPTKPSNERPLPYAAALAKTDERGRYELNNLPAGDYYLGVNLTMSPSRYIPYARCFFPGTEDASQAGTITIGPEAVSRKFDFAIPASLRERLIEGFVFWPDGRPGENVDVLLEDPHSTWPTVMVAGRTDVKGHFRVLAFAGTAYRVHAVTKARLAADVMSAEPQPVGAGTDAGKALRLVLTRKGHSTQQTGKGLERWKAGLGL